MVRHVNVPLDDDAYEALEAVKGERSWEQALLEEFGVAEQVRE